ASRPAPTASQRITSGGRIPGRCNPNLSEIIDTLHLLCAAACPPAKSGFVPWQSLHEAGPDIVSRIVPQQAPRLAYIGLRMSDVPGTELLVDRRRESQVLMSLPDQATQCIKQHVERHAPAHRDVLDLAEDLRIAAGRRQHVGLHDIGDVTEVA